MWKLRTHVNTLILLTFRSLFLVVVLSRHALYSTYDGYDPNGYLSLDSEQDFNSPIEYGTYVELLENAMT